MKGTRFHPSPAPARKQRGAVLLVGLVMLVLVTIAAVTSYNLSRSGLQAVSNMGYRNDVAAAAQQAIEDAISSIAFAEKPAAVFELSGGCGGNPNGRCYDIDGDGVEDLEVALEPNPECRVGRVLRTQELDLTNPEDLGCSVSAGQSFGVVGTTQPASLCAQTLWNIRAVAEDRTTRARTAVSQGVSVRVPSGDLSTACP